MVTLLHRKLFHCQDWNPERIFWNPKVVKTQQLKSCWFLGTVKVCRVTQIQNEMQSINIYLARGIWMFLGVFWAIFVCPKGMTPKKYLAHPCMIVEPGFVQAKLWTWSILARETGFQFSRFQRRWECIGRFFNTIESRHYTYNSACPHKNQ